MKISLHFSRTQSVAVLLAAALGCAGIVGCHSRSTPASSAAASTAKEYHIRGKVISVDAKSGTVMLDAEKIPGFMDAMIMPYKLIDPSVASALHPGDVVTAQLRMHSGGAVLTEIDVVSEARLNVLPPVQFHVPKPGDPVPNFKLLNQSDRTIGLHQFRGKTLVLTFIYTRCQSSQFCPLMSRNFAKLDKMLAANPKLYRRTHLLSISFDPKYDTPAVLRSYGGAYTGRFTQETFQHWDFAAPSVKELASVLQWFDVGITSNDGGKVLLHSLSTVVVGPDGKVRYWYPTNTWTPDQVYRDIQQILSSPAGSSKA